MSSGAPPRARQKRAKGLRELIVIIIENVKVNLLLEPMIPSGSFSDITVP